MYAHMFYTNSKFYTHMIYILTMAHTSIYINSFFRSVQANKRGFRRCVYVYMYVYMYVCFKHVRVYVCDYAGVYMYICKSICMRVANISTRFCWCVYVYMHVCMYVCLCVLSYVCARGYVFFRVFLDKLKHGMCVVRKLEACHVWLCVCVCMAVCMCMYVCVWEQRHNMIMII
jgi:hypothetical protein